MWLRQLLFKLGFTPTSPTILHEDNKSAIQIAINGNDKGRTKHMDIRYHLVRDLVRSNQIVLKFIPTESMVVCQTTIKKAGKAWVIRLLGYIGYRLGYIYKTRLRATYVNLRTSALEGIHRIYSLSKG